MNLVQKKLNIGFSLALICACIFGVIAHFTTSDLVATSKLVAHTHEVVRSLESILVAIGEAESSSRGFFITQDPDYRVEFELTLRKGEIQIKQLERLVADNPQQAAQIPRLKAAVADKVAFMHKALTVQDTSGFPATRALLQTGAGKAAMKEIQSIVHRMKDTEVDLLSRREEKSAIAAQRAMLIFAILTIVILVLLVLLYLVAKNDLAQRQKTAQELAVARDLALESSRLKSEFLATMSHEIRTPMNGVIGMTNLLLETPLDPEQRDFADTVRKSADSLLTIIDDILDFSKIESGKLHFEIIDFELEDAVAGAVDLLAERAQSKRVELAFNIEPDVPRLLCGDPGRLRQVLTNLLGNAIKFTEQGEVILTVSITGQPGNTALLRFSIQDTGIGIAPQAVGRLFQPFTQADGSTTRKYGGTGLGLAISKQLVERMGGAIGVQSVLGQGSNFWFTARLEKQANPSVIGTHPLAEPDIAGLELLVVDDNETNRKILQNQLRSWNISSLAASNADEALVLVRRHSAAGRSFALAILDMQMPGMDGLDLARAIKSDPGAAPTRIIILSSIGNRLSPETMAASSVDACLLKPIKPSKLLSSLKSSLSLPPQRHLAQLDAPPSVPSQRHVRVLLAEDNIVNQKVALRQLQKLGYSADAAANGLEVLEAIGRISYNIILMDCQMPELDGYETTARIRAMEKASGSVRLHIIAMTANAMDGDREKCLACGMDDYISKPVRTEELAVKLNALSAG